MSGAPASIDARPHLVLVHGLNNTPSVWDGVIAGIAARAHCHVPFLPALDSVDAIADGLLPTLPARFHLCGFSFGGFVALAMLARAPERVAGFALLNSTVLADDPGLAGQRRRAIEIAAGGGHRAMMDKQYPNSVETAHVANAALQQRFGRMVDEYGAERFVAHMRAVLERPDRRTLVAAATARCWRSLRARTASCRPPCSAPWSRSPSGRIRSRSTAPRTCCRWSDPVSWPPRYAIGSTAL